MNKKGMDIEKVENILDEMGSRNISFGSGRIFGSMCTAPHPFALEVHRRFHESNLGNPGLYPGTAEMERQVISMLGDIFGLPDVNGHVLSGGTEANITSMYTAKKKGEGKRVLFPRSAHFSVLKAVRLLDLEPVPIDLDRDFRMDTQDLEDKIGDDTLMILSVAGTTELGAVDPMERISKVKGDVPLHVDAAFGGFVLPFLDDLGIEDPRIGPWDFSVSGVDTLSTDPHKMGWSTIPAGCLLFRNLDPLKYLAVGSPYLTSTRAYTLAGTRDSGAVASIFALMKHLGREGYADLVKGCMENTHYLKKRLMELGLEPVMEPTINVLAVRHDEPERVQQDLASRGYYISKVEEPTALRFVVMPHVTVKAIDDLMVEMEKVLR
ncbi:MAG: tyrosine decarboxylase MfnA [Candidatus Thermoplasmatota archaeon]|nr:tyrosine decarboxylase MfnA [Candidatus Thermoplasmatota archaeon]